MNQQTLFITGGSGKLGKVFVDHFLSQGHVIVTTCFSSKSFEGMQLKYKKYGERFLPIQIDFTNNNSIETIVEKLDQLNILPNCLVNNARSLNFLKIGNNGLISRENFTMEYLLDVIVPYELTMALVQRKDSKIRNILNIGSQYGVVAANPNLYLDPTNQSPLHYSVAKAALIHLTKELAVRLASKGVNVNCVAFGGVEGRVDEEFKKRYSQLCPMGRMLSEDEIIGPVELLLSNKGSGITGHTLSVDGGWSIW